MGVRVWLGCFSALLNYLLVCQTDNTTQTLSKRQAPAYDLLCSLPALTCWITNSATLSVSATLSNTLPYYSLIRSCCIQHVVGSNVSTRTDTALIPKPIFALRNFYCALNRSAAPLILPHAFFCTLITTNTCRCVGLLPITQWFSSRFLTVGAPLPPYRITRPTK